MDPKRVAEIEQMLTNRHDMLHYNMKALRRAGLELLAEAKRLSENIHAYAFESGRVSLKCQDQSKEIESLKRQLEMAAEHQVSEMVCPSKMLENTCRDAGDCKTCWLEYWRQKATTSKKNTVGEGANG